ncbi:MAG: hypothetical protein JWN94_2153 [Betaproteobacteria bacterium]|nr:hypothetical protein [Betaproteobacteria bacterium]
MSTASDRMTNACAWIGSLVALVAVSLPLAVNAAGVAMVTDLQGKASIGADGRTRDVTILSELETGAQVQLAAGATLVVLYLDAGDEYVFKGPAAIVFKPAQPDVTSGAKPQKRSPSLGKGGSSIRIKPVGVAQGAMVMRGFLTGARIQLLNLHKTRTLETQPEFRWQPIQDGVKYQFELTDDTGRVVHEAQVEAVSLKVPAGLTLKEGVPYSWEVSARLPDGKKYSSSADFAVAPADVRAQAEALRPAAAAPLSSRIAYAAWLDQVELKDEARKYWKTAAAERPEDPRLKALAGQ